MGEKIENINVLLVKRNMPSKGPTSSSAINDTISEVSRDLLEIQDQWNNRLVSLAAALPDGSPTSSVDAFTNGLDGRNLYVDQDATTVYHSTYYAPGPGRPSTVYEQFESIYTSLTALEEEIDNQINGLARTASQVSIADRANLYTATNVETALAEVRVAVNLLSTNITAVLTTPSIDNYYSIGTSSYRWKEEYLGAGGLHLYVLAGEGGGSIRDYSFQVDTSGYFLLKDSSSTTLRIEPTTGSLTAYQTLDQSEGVVSGLAINCDVQQSGDAAYQTLLLDITETSTGTGSHEAISMLLDSVSGFCLRSNGQVRPSGGTSVTPAYSFLNVEGVGVYLDTEDDLGFAVSGIEPAKIDGYGLIANNLVIGPSSTGFISVDAHVYQSIPSTLTPSGATQTIDWNDGNIQFLDLEDASGDVTVTLSNPRIGGIYILKIIQDSAVARDIIWPAEVFWADGGAAPVITTTADAVDMVTMIWDGTNYLAGISQDYQ